MQLFLNILLFIAGLAALVGGAELFVRSASNLAKRLRVSTLMMGLTVLALGTGLPEVVMALIGGITGRTDLALGNILGSNMVNILLIMGLAAVIVPLTVQKETKKIDLPALMIMSFMLLIFCLDPWLNGSNVNIFSRAEAIIMLLAVAIYETIIIVNARRTTAPKFELKQQAEVIFTPEVETSSEGKTDSETIVDSQGETQAEQEPQQAGHEQEQIKTLPTVTAPTEIIVAPPIQPVIIIKENSKLWVVLLMLFGGIISVGAGGQAVNISCEVIATMAGMSESLIGATIVGVCTNFPELFTMLFAIRRKENDMAVGTLIGSNILNAGFILSIMGVTSQIIVTSNVIIDMVMMLVATIIVSVAAFTKNRISRLEGIMLLVMYVGYITYVIIRN